jgi:hypothetical protein
MSSYGSIAISSFLPSVEVADDSDRKILVLGLWQRRT